MGRYDSFRKAKQYRVNIPPSFDTEEIARRRVIMSKGPSSCSWHLATYLVGWLLSACGIGLMILSSDPVTTKGSWLIVLVAGIACGALGGTLIVIAVSIPDNRSEWCGDRARTGHRNGVRKYGKDVFKKHEGIYIRFESNGQGDHANGSGNAGYQSTPVRDVPSATLTSPTICKDPADYKYKSRSLDTSLIFGMPDKYNGNLYVPPPASWNSTLIRSHSYEEADENTAIMFYRETPV